MVVAWEEVLERLESLSRPLRSEHTTIIRDSESSRFFPIRVYDALISTEIFAHLMSVRWLLTASPPGYALGLELGNSH